MLNTDVCIWIIRLQIWTYYTASAQTFLRSSCVEFINKFIQ